VAAPPDGNGTLIMRIGVRTSLVAALALTLAAPVAAQAPRSLSDSAFAALVARLSEPGGYFDTDNLITNEDSYLHPLTTLRQVGVNGGVYVGVGPDQNFSYIAAIRPRAAIIIDIRRDNLLEHLLFKALFAQSRNRIDFLSLLFGKPLPADTAGWGARSIDSLLAHLNRTRSTTSPIDRVIAEVRAMRVSITAAELETIRRFHTAFLAEGPALRFTSFGRAPAAGYPDFAQLASERDREGRQRSYLASESAFQVVKSLSDRNLIIPVTGNFAGAKAFAEVAKWMTTNGERLSALYASNVEQYLIRDGGFDAFARNVESLPRDAKSVIIRSCFNACRDGHPSAVSGYYSVQMAQLADSFVVLYKSGRIRSYYDLVSLGIRPSP
jgi:hypothetical protein